MIKLSRLSDYAVVVLEVLSRADTAQRSASDIAALAKLPEPTVAKVLKSLAAAELVTSTRGVNGGYQLTRPAQQITVQDIVTAIEGPVVLTACVDEGEDDPCALVRHCALSGRWDKVNLAVKAALSNITLADMMLPENAPQNRSAA